MSYNGESSLIIFENVLSSSMSTWLAERIPPLGSNIFNATTGIFISPTIPDITIESPISYSALSVSTIKESFSANDGTSIVGMIRISNNEISVLDPNTLFQI